MKKFLTITGICIATLLLVVLIIPFALKGKVGDIVKSEGNKLLNAQFDFKTLDISLIRHFPSATISLEDFWIKGVGKFEKDTLAQAKELSASVNLFSLFGDGGYQISKISINDAQVKAVVLEDGSVNWDVVKADPHSQEKETDKQNTSFNLQLDDVAIHHLSVVYDDQQAKIRAEVTNLNANCSGNFGSDQTLIKLKTETPSLSFSMNEIPYLKKVQLSANMDVDADFKEGKFTFKDNTLDLNAMRAQLNGWLQDTEQGLNMDLNLQSNQIGFKEILSLIPGIYTKDFKGLKTDGKVNFSAFANGSLAGDSIVPQFEVNLNVKDASFHYPSLPHKVEKINTNLSVKNPGGNPDATTIDIEPFQFVLAGHPFGITAHFKTPISDLAMNASAKGMLDLGKIKDIYPMKDMHLNGKIDADLMMSGRLSAIQKEQYEQIQAEGQLNLQDMNLKLKNMPELDIQQSTFNFSPRTLHLSETTITMGDNDLTIDSQFSNYLAYLFQGKTLKGSLTISSNRLNLNDFMTEASLTEAVNDSVKEVKGVKGESFDANKQKEPIALVIPNNIDFKLQTDLKHVMFNKMNFEEINGLLMVKDQKVDMSNLSMKTMGGQVTANGIYATPKDQPASLNGSFKLDQLNFNRTYSELDMVKQLAPIFAGLKGTYSGNITINSQLDELMNAKLETIQGEGSLSTKDISLSGVKFIDQVAGIIKQPQLKDIRVQDLKLDFTIDKGRVTTAPFNLRLGDCVMNLAGSSGLDQTIDYTGKITLPQLPGFKNQGGTVDMLIKGTFDSPSVSIDMESLAKNLASQALENLTGKGQKNKGDSTTTHKNIFDKARDLFKKK